MELSPDGSLCNPRQRPPALRTDGETRGRIQSSRRAVSQLDGTQQDSLPISRRAQPGLKTPAGKAAVVAAIQEGRQRRIAELAFEGKRIHTSRRRPKPELSPEAQRIDGPSALG